MATSPAVMSATGPGVADHHDQDEIMGNTGSDAPSLATVTRAAAVTVAAAATVASVAVSSVSNNGPAMLDRARGLAAGLGSSSGGRQTRGLSAATPRTIATTRLDGVIVGGSGAGRDALGRDRESSTHCFTGQTRGGRITKSRPSQRPSSAVTAGSSPVVRLAAAAAKGPSGEASTEGPKGTGGAVSRHSDDPAPATSAAASAASASPSSHFDSSSAAALLASTLGFINAGDSTSSLATRITGLPSSSSSPTSSLSPLSTSIPIPAAVAASLIASDRPGYPTRSSSASSSASATSQSESSSSRPTLSSATSSSSSVHPSSHATLHGSNNKRPAPAPSAATQRSGKHKHSRSSSIAGVSSSSTNPNAMAIDDAPVLTFWGPDPVPLPNRFARIKRNLIAGHEAAIEASFHRLIRALRSEMEHIEGLGAHLIPSIEFSDIEDPAQTARFGRDLRHYGVGVVRRVVPKHDADDMVSSTMRYLDTRAAQSLEPLKQDPTCYDFFWTPAQVRARAHPSVLSAQRFMMGLWETSPEDRLATKLPISYVDRIRIHNPAGANVPLQDTIAKTNGEANGASARAGGGDASGTATSSADAGHGAGADSKFKDLLEPQEEPQSADDWVVALQSSAGIIAQVDNGSLERWEPDGYGRTGTYSRVFQGDWESYDPWECASRVPATMDLYNGHGACTIFRMFQGIVGLSTVEPGLLRLLPSPKLATAYYLLRPFFSARTPPPEVRSGPEWEAYLDPSNWKLEREPDTIIHGAVPGHAQRITERWHPHLNLRSSMITLPTLQPGDYILWHPDLPYHISSGNPGLQTPRHHHSLPDPVTMLVYIPAAPLTQTNALYLARQRKAFQRGLSGPDFDVSSSGRAFNLEDPSVRPGEKDIAEVGGPEGLRAMGLAPWESSGTPVGDQATRADNDGATTNGSTNGNIGDDKSTTSSTSSSRAEAEVVRLSNIILFPDLSMMGYSV